MKKVISRESATLFFGMNDDDAKAVNLVKSSRIPCNFIGVSNDETPILYWGWQEFRGLNRIKAAISRL